MSAYAAVNAWANGLEDRISKWPGMGWFHYNTTGDPVSWLQHALWAALFTYGWSLFGDAGTGAWVAFWLYVARELYGAWTGWRARGFWPAVLRETRPRESYQKGLYVGWGVDAVMDVVGPLLVAVIA